MCVMQRVDIVPQTPLVLLPVDDSVRASTPLVRSVCEYLFNFYTYFFLTLEYLFVCYSIITGTSRVCA